MKLFGKVIDAPKPEVVAIPRGDQKFIFTLRPVTDFTELDRINPVPVLKRLLPGGITEIDTVSPEYKKAISDYFEKRTNWLIIQSLLGTEGLTFDKINPAEPETWKFLEEELKGLGLSTPEANFLINKIHEVSGFDMGRIEEATKSFLAGREAALKE